jgi:membrane-bound ClpP family serine protease
MTLILSVIIISYFLIGMEAIVPGGILGILGFIGLVIATYFSAQEFGGWFAPSVTFLLSGMGALLLLFLEFKWLDRSPFGKNLFLKKTIEGSSNQLNPITKLVGLRGVTLTDLHPEGLIEVATDQYDAFSEDGYLPKGTKIKITGSDDFRLRVSSDP